MNELSVTVITLNEEDNIKGCILSVKNIADEIILVDSGSKDKTVEIAKELGAKTYFRKFDSFDQQKNWAVSKCSGDWVLSLDADERVPGDLGEEIKRSIQSSDCVGFLMGRRNFILGGEIKHTRWSPDEHIWVWKKDLGRWEGKVHEEVVLNGKIGRLNGKKIHYSHKTVADFFSANNKYSSLEVEKADKIKFSYFKLFWDPLFEFALRFFYKKGFLDGWRGFILSVLMAVYKISVWVKLWELDAFKKNK